MLSRSWREVPQFRTVETLFTKPITGSVCAGRDWADILARWFPRRHSRSWSGRNLSTTSGFQTVRPDPVPIPAVFVRHSSYFEQAESGSGQRQERQIVQS